MLSIGSDGIGIGFCRYRRAPVSATSSFIQPQFIQSLMSHPPPSSHRLARRMPLTQDMIAELHDHVGRTGTGSARLLRGAKDKPQGLKSGIVDSWLHGLVESVRPEYHAYVLARWASLPDRRRMPLTTEMSATLNAEMVRTGLGPVTALRGGRDRPPDLTHAVVSGSAGATVNTVAVEHWEYLLGRLRALPDATTPTRSRLVQRRVRQAITEGELAELRVHRERTGRGGGVLLRNAPDKPPGVTSAMISNWLSGRSKMADSDHIAYVLARYRAWP